MTAPIAAVYEPPAIAERAAIDVPLVGAGSGVVLSAVFRSA
jgi:hypothetical protein